jgi:hypothetical protein
VNHQLEAESLDVRVGKVFAIRQSDVGVRFRFRTMAWVAWRQVSAAVVVLAGATIVDAQTFTARIHALGRPSSAAEVLQVSPQTVTRDWRLMRAGFARELRADESSSA